MMSKAGSGFQEAGLAVIGILMAVVLLPVCRFRPGKLVIWLRNADFLVLAPFCVGTGNSGGCNEF